MAKLRLELVYDEYDKDYNAWVYCNCGSEHCAPLSDISGGLTSNDDKCGQLNDPELRVVLLRAIRQRFEFGVYQNIQEELKDFLIATRNLELKLLTMEK